MRCNGLYQIHVITSFMEALTFYQYVMVGMAMAIGNRVEMIETRDIGEHQCIPFLFVQWISLPLIKTLRLWF